MELPLIILIVLCATATTLPPARSLPVKVDFNLCQPAIFVNDGLTPNVITTTNCCPPKYNTPIIDGLPPLTSFKRVRPALQCTDAEYAKKLQAAYAIMRSLPDDDPRSYTQQWHLHCAYCTNSFYSPGFSNVGIDIHYGWFFFPWHRLYLYFHERILQSLIGDPTFSLGYWNWDNPFTVNEDSSSQGACLKAGDDFPLPYSDPTQSTYDPFRSPSAKGYGRLHFPDLNYIPLLNAAQQPLANAPADVVIESNLNSVYQSLVSGGTNAQTFMGAPLRVGDPIHNFTQNGGSGALESGAHKSVHLWTGLNAPSMPNDMGSIPYSAKDPVFFAHHANIDRLYEIWREIGPLLGQDRNLYSDPDFLEAEFLFFDENKDTRRVKLRDALYLETFGYEYQAANDAAWLFFNATKCSNADYSQTISQAQTLPYPFQDSNKFYNILPGTPFQIIVDRPQNYHGEEEFLLISDIHLDTSVNDGFDVYVNLLFPYSYVKPTKCAEYGGRFMNMAQSVCRSGQAKVYDWKQSISRTLVETHAPDYASKLAITIVPMGPRVISFRSIAIVHN